MHHDGVSELKLSAIPRVSSVGFSPSSLLWAGADSGRRGRALAEARGWQMLASCHAPESLSHDRDAGDTACVTIRDSVTWHLSRWCCGWCLVPDSVEKVPFPNELEWHRLARIIDKVSSFPKTNIAQCCYYFSDKNLIVNVPPHKDWENKKEPLQVVLLLSALQLLVAGLKLSSAFLSPLYVNTPDLSLYLFLI